MGSAYDAKEIRASAAVRPRPDHWPQPPHPRTQAEPRPAGRQSLPGRAAAPAGVHDAERVNGRFKDELGGRRTHVRGPVKVMTHLMFGICVLSVDQLIRMLH